MGFGAEGGVVCVYASLKDGNCAGRISGAALPLVVLEGEASLD